MKWTRRSTAVTLVSVCVAGVLLVGASNSFDEFAPLDRLGARIEPARTTWPQALRRWSSYDQSMRIYSARFNRPALASLGGKPNQVRAMSRGQYVYGDARVRIWSLPPGAESARQLEHFFSPGRGWANSDPSSIEYDGAGGRYSLTRYRYNTETGTCVSVLKDPNIAPSDSGQILVCIEEPEDSTHFWPRLKRRAHLIFRR
jgi:hypothetical protein